MLNLVKFFMIITILGKIIYNFLLSQQNGEAAYVPKNFSYRNSFEAYISSFSQNFSIDDQ